MVISASPAELVGLVVALIVCGAISGLLAGIFGIGGGAIIVPVLYQALAALGVDDAVRMHVSIGSSLAIIAPTSIRSFMEHRRRGAVDMQLMASWLVPVPLGVAAASYVASMLSGTTLRAIFAAFAALVSIRLLFGRESWRIADDLPGNPLRTLVGAFTGFISGLLGIGGGVVTNTFMTLYGRPIHQAVATSAGIGALISLPGIVGYVWAGWGDIALPPFSAGFVNLVAVLLVIPVSVLVAPVGVRIAHALSKRQLEVGFGLFLLAVSVRFAISLT